ncbi:hypothetical protein ACFR9U_08950 [Halorientalis brevis]|uniref:Halobacterial output domain-containing protein n=1 Tax=Halorientalis brevis TaxID=1126241 RepID=A0ABD6C9T9_9EURY|nr:hypothetical protein [Halorientalis brevis]
MVGETLGKLRARIESLARDDGDFCVLCGRTGVRPVPVTDARFEDRATAEQAAEAATTYRAVLRRWDPRAPCYDFIACEVPEGLGVGPGRRATATGRRNASLTGFCHDVAAAVFEALSAEGFADAESAIMDAYCESADAIDDPDDLCLHLLTTLAAEFDSQLTSAEQARVLRTAAGEFPGPNTGGTPLTQTFERLQTVTIIGDYAVESSPEWVVGQQSWTVTIDDYALPTAPDAMPTLPIVIDLLRRLPRARLALSDVRQLDGGSWRFEVSASENGPSTGLAWVQATG